MIPHHCYPLTPQTSTNTKMWEVWLLRELWLTLRISQKLVDLPRLSSPCPTISLVTVFHVALGLDSCSDPRPICKYNRVCLFGISSVFSLFLTELLIVEVVSGIFVFEGLRTSKYIRIAVPQQYDWWLGYAFSKIRNTWVLPALLSSFINVVPFWREMRR